MRISAELTEEDKKGLKKNGVVFPDGQDPHFQIKEAPLLPGTKRLHSGKIIPYTPIEQCLK